MSDPSKLCADIGPSNLDYMDGVSFADVTMDMNLALL